MSNSLTPLPRPMTGIVLGAGGRGSGNPGAITRVGTPVGVLRADARPPGGGVAGSDPQFLIEHHLDRYDIDYAILIGGGILGISRNPDLDYANAVASAHNE